MKNNTIIEKNINSICKCNENSKNKNTNYIVIKLPNFRAVSSGIQSWDYMFKEGGGMNQLWEYTHLYKNVIFDCFDFLISKSDGAEWICAIKDDVTSKDVSNFNIIDFPGGIYVVAISKDEDNDSLNKVEENVKSWIKRTSFEMDDNREILINMPYMYEEGKDLDLKKIEKGLGYKQLQRFFPLKLKT